MLLYSTITISNETWMLTESNDTLFRIKKQRGFDVKLNRYKMIRFAVTQEFPTLKAFKFSHFTCSS